MNTILILTAVALVTMFAGVYNKRGLLLPITVIGTLLGLVLILAEWHVDPNGLYDNYMLKFFNMVHIQNSNSTIIMKYMAGMMDFDNYAIAFSAVILLGAMFVFFLTDHYFSKTDKNVGDIYALLIFTVIGALIMVSYTHLSMLFIGIETLSISLYVLAGSRKMDLASNEASIKYFLMGSFSTGFLLFGIALLYGASGSMDLVGLRQYAVAHHDALPILFKAGLFMVLVGLFFKVSAVPFHFWAPDVYQGSPTLITTFMATVVKTAGFAALLRFLFYAFGSELPMWHYTMWVVAALTILVGNFSAVYQSSVKRMLAYSSVANAGYLLLGILSMNNETPASIFYYTFAYSLATISAFSVLMVVSAERGSDDYEAFNGLARRSPLLATLMVIAMLSLAGIPPLAGFFAKYFIFKSAMSSNMNGTDNSYLYLVLVAVVNSLIGVYYYFRVIVAIFTPDPNAEQPISIKLSYRIVLGAAAALLLISGLFPNQLINPMVESNVTNVSSNKQLVPATGNIAPSANTTVIAKPATGSNGQSNL